MSKDNGFGMKLFQLAYFGHGNRNQFTLALPDLYKKTNGENHRLHLPEISLGLGLILTGILYFAR